MFRQKGNLTCVTWRDRKPVTFLSTIPTSITDSNLLQRSVKENGQWIQKDFVRPGIVDLYNTHMGGVDVSDQRAVTYASLIKGVVWYYKVFFYMVEVCVSNAYILHTKSPNNANMRSFDVRRKLVTQLIEGRCFRRDSGSHQVPPPVVRFNRDYFHPLVTNDTRSICKVHVQSENRVQLCNLWCQNVSRTMF